MFSFLTFKGFVFSFLKTFSTYKKKFLYLLAILYYLVGISLLFVFDFSETVFIYMPESLSSVIINNSLINYFIPDADKILYKTVIFLLLIIPSSLFLLIYLIIPRLIFMPVVLISGFTIKVITAIYTKSFCYLDL
jgi:hypothetical protein